MRPLCLNGITIAMVFACWSPAQAQNIVTLTLDEAIQIALVSNYALQEVRMDAAVARAEVRNAWSETMPRVDASSGYTRNLRTANPFAGSAAGDFFSGFAFIGWLAYNEDARTDDDPTTMPISFDEFDRRQTQGLEDANIVLAGGDNPFQVENQFVSTINVTQKLFDSSAMAGLRAAARVSDVFSRAVDRQEQVVIDQVRRAFYQALLDRERALVAAESVVRAEKTLSETTRRVAQGVAPKFQRLSADVQLANLQSLLVDTENRADASLDDFKFLLGIPVETDVRLRGSLEADTHWFAVSDGDAVAAALDRRPDLEQARLTEEIHALNLSVARSNRIPKLSAFANLSFLGSVPDNRTFTITSNDDPFLFTKGQNDFFSSSYWQPSINVGFSLTWTLFDGFATSALIQQRRIDISRAKLQTLSLRESVRLEVARAKRDLAGARQQIAAQEKNVANAELSYTYASARLAEGVATPLEERDASDQLDQSRLNLLQAVFDFLVARSAFETAVGIPLGQQSDIQLTSNRSVP